MARPQIKAQKAKPKKPTGLPKPRAKPKKKESAAKGAAQEAVQEYETQRRVLNEMREQWDDNFPEARLAKEDILRQEDFVEDTIKKAKPLVSAAKETVGEFIAKRKFSKPHYDTEAVTKLLGEFENGPEIFGAMLEAGIIKVVDLQREAAVAWFAQNPEMAEAFVDAFCEEAEMTTAVTVPKL